MPHHYLVGNDYRDSVFNTIISVRHQSKKRIAVYKHNDRAKDHKKTASVSLRGSLNSNINTKA